MISTDLSRFLRSGVSIHIATCDAGRVPHGARAWAAVPEDDGEHVTVFVLKASARPILDDLEANGRAALVFCRPTDDRAVQLKGAFAGSRPARAKEREVVDAHGARMIAELEAIGVPAALTRAWKPWPCIAIRVRVTEIYSQTPGPGAGEPLR